MQTGIVRAIVVLIAVGLILFLSILNHVALADSVSTAATLAKMEQSDLSRVQACRMMKMHGDGFIGKVGNLSYAIRCFSVGDQLTSCEMMAVNAATFLDLERRSQSRFAALTNKIENDSGASLEEINGLSLAESAPVNTSPDQFGRNVYKQCSSYAEIR